jgi:L-alanine-DL-glutamate epimerase-like enolase superfamily enzyme
MAGAFRKPSAAVERLEVRAYTVPTEEPQSDGTFEWDATTMVVAEVQGGGMRGLGYTYGPRACATLVREKLEDIVIGRDAMDVSGSWWAMVGALRNAGRPGIGSMSIAAVDVALWDLKARILDVSLTELLGRIRDWIPVYGSGGFTSYSISRLREQLSGWVDQGISMVKMKVGRDPREDEARVAAAREVIGPGVQLFVDANGAYARRQALAKANVFAPRGVTWFEEPVSSDDLEGLRFIRDRSPAGMEITAGEYGYDVWYFRRMLEAGAVDVLQADATRCGGITGFLQAAELCVAHGVPLSAHTAPALHATLGCAVAKMRHVEYFHDHVRIEGMLLDGVPRPENGRLAPVEGPGLGLELRREDAERYAA